MEKEELRKVIKKSVENIWYNRRSVNPVEDQTNILTEEIYKHLENEMQPSQREIVPSPPRQVETVVLRCERKEYE